MAVYVVDHPLVRHKLGILRMPGDEIITAAAGFPTTIAPILQVGATPVFVDIDPQTWNVTPAVVARAITPKTRGVVLAHTLGMPSLQRIAGAYGLPYVRIEDDSQIEKGVQSAMQTKGPVLCEVLGDMAFDEIPKCISYVNAEGKRVSAALENPFPFLSESVVREIFERFDTTE
jgi:Predicted pyridoxal phosphate-dependent enzyme apparently involved in regulation of cell wall biogenesis